MSFVETIDDVARTIEQNLKVDGKTVTVYRCTGLGELLGGGVQSPCATVYLSFQSPRRAETGQEWEVFPPDISVSIGYSCHRDNLSDAARCVYQALEDLMALAPATGFHRPGISHLGSYGSNADARSWLASGTVLFGSVS